MTHDEHLPGTRSIRLATIGVLAAAGLLVSACSSSGSTSGTGSAGSASNSGPASSASSSAAPSTSSAGSSTVSSGASTPATSSSAASKAASGGGGLGSGSFCDIAKKEQAQSKQEAASLATGSPAALQKLETDALAELKLFVAIAPGPIKSDVGVIAAADQKIFNALKAAKFQITKISPTVLSAVDTPAFDAAAKHVTAYLATSCGIKASTSN